MLSRCIYSLQDETNASFKQAEHIIPKAIGGMYTLPKGMVSDAVNHEFSEFEEHVIKMRRKTPSFRAGDIRRVRRICVSN